VARGMLVCSVPNPSCETRRFKIASPASCSHHGPLLSATCSDVPRWEDGTSTQEAQSTKAHNLKGFLSTPRGLRPTAKIGR
jgi:hypothetical protein